MAVSVAYFKKAIKMMFTLRRFSKPLNVTLAALLLACTMPAWADNEAQFKQAMTAYEAGHYSQALRLLQPLAQQGDAKAQYNLGLLYENGWGVTQNYKKAVAWYQKAANQGIAEAQYNLGVMYEKGRGVQQAYKQAAAWYEKAANQGYVQAQNNLGAWYEVHRDYEQAMFWYQKAANQGHARSQLNLGLLYYDGKGVAQDEQQAKAWWQKVLAQPDTPENAKVKEWARAFMKLEKESSH